VGELAPAHLIILGIVILLVFGSRKLPEIARGLGTGMREFRDSLQGIERPEPPADPAPPVEAPVTESRVTPDDATRTGGRPASGR
jgi:sec-independent protein translocase protein TatA